MLLQVTCLSKSFTFDKVYGSCGAEPSDGLFPECVRPLVDGLFKGYNATVFAFGQTGSGKTYTMGSAYTPGGNTSGVIPEVLELIFDRINSSKDVDCNVRASFVEIHKVRTPSSSVVVGLDLSGHRGGRRLQMLAIVLALCALVERGRPRGAAAFLAVPGQAVAVVGE